MRNLLPLGSDVSEHRKFLRITRHLLEYTGYHTPRVPWTNVRSITILDAW